MFSGPEEGGEIKGFFMNNPQMVHFRVFKLFLLLLSGWEWHLGPLSIVVKRNFKKLKAQM